MPCHFLFLKLSLFHVPLSFSLTCLLASSVFYFHITTLFQWNLSKCRGSGNTGKGSVRVPYLPLNCKTALVVLLLRGAIKAGKL